MNSDHKNERKKFEQVVQYRQFLEQYKDGSYKLEWVERLWQGWLLKVEDLKNDHYE